MNLELKALLPLTGETWSTPAIAIDGKGRRLLIGVDRAGSLRAWDGKDLSKVWERKFAPMTGSPTVFPSASGLGEKLVIGDHSGNLHCLHPDSGETLWRTTCGSCIRSTAAFAVVEGQRRLFVTGYGTWMFCLDADSGAIVWRRYLPKHETQRRSGHGAVSSPLIADVDGDGRLEVVVGTRARRLYCLSALSGRMVWFTALKYDPDSSPTLLVLDGVPRVLVGGGEHTSGIGDNSLIAVNGMTGEIDWTIGIHGAIDSCPIVAALSPGAKPSVFACSLADASVYAFRTENPMVQWRYRFRQEESCFHDQDNVCRPLASRTYFTEHAVCRSYTTPLVADLEGNGDLSVVAGSCNGELVALRADTGAVLFSEKTGGLCRGSPILSDIDGDGKLELIVPSGSTIRVYVACGASPQVDWRQFKGDASHSGLAAWTNGPITAPRRSPSWVWPRLVWDWLVVDAVRVLLFHLERRILSHMGIRLRPYYY